MDLNAFTPMALTMRSHCTSIGSISISQQHPPKQRRTNLSSVWMPCAKREMILLNWRIRCITAVHTPCWIMQNANAFSVHFHLWSDAQKHLVDDAFFVFIPVHFVVVGQHLCVYAWTALNGRGHAHGSLNVDNNIVKMHLIKTNYIQSLHTHEMDLCSGCVRGVVIAMRKRRPCPREQPSFINDIT